MTTTTLDDLIIRLQESRAAAGRNLPVRLKIEVDYARDDYSPSHLFVSVERVKVMPCIGEEGEFVQLAATGAALA